LALFFFDSGYKIGLSAHHHWRKKMKKIFRLFTGAVLALLCVSVGKAIIGDYRGDIKIVANAEQEIYTVQLDSTNQYSELTSAVKDFNPTVSYVPSRAMEWTILAPAFAPENGHIGIHYSYEMGWRTFYNSHYPFTGVKSVTVTFEKSGTWSALRLFYGTSPGSQPNYIDLNSQTSPYSLDSSIIDAYQAIFYMGFRFYGYAGSEFIINSVVITYTCA
jgi:hypothetical protein